MAVKKKPTIRTDAKGDVHKTFPDGRTEIYHKGKHDDVVDLDGTFMEVTDELDESINRKRFIPWTKNESTVEDSLTVRDDAVPGIDVDHPDNDRDVERDVG